MRFGEKNPRSAYFMGVVHGKRWERTESSLKRDLGILVAEDLAWGGHISTIVNKANRIQGILLKAFSNRSFKRPI